MIEPQFERTAYLIGEENVKKLKNSHVIIFGIGGVGSYIAEALCRTGVGELTLVDGDCYSETNLNRQLFALHSTIGEMKTEAAKKRLLDINPDCIIHTVNEYVREDNIDRFFEGNYSFCADAIDDTTAKVLIALKCRDKSIPLIASMGTGNKISSEEFTVTDIGKTEYCPLCRTMRKKYKEAGIGKVTVLYSRSQPIKQTVSIPAGEAGTRRPPASIAFIPAIAGLKIAEHIVRSLTQL